MKKALAIIVGIINLVWIVLCLAAVSTTADITVTIISLLITLQFIINTTYIVLYTINLFKKENVK